MRVIKVIENQSLRDVAIAYYGSIEAVGELLELNQDILKNDSKALVAAGVDPLLGRLLYLDVALTIGLELTINTASALFKKNVIRELSTPQTKYEQ